MVGSSSLEVRLVNAASKHGLQWLVDTGADLDADHDNPGGGTAPRHKHFDNMVAVRVTAYAASTMRALYATGTCSMRLTEAATSFRSLLPHGASEDGTSATTS